MTPTQRKSILALSIIVGISYLVGACLTFTLAPMMADLGMTSDQGDLALAIPAAASLFIVFIVGRLGDQLGHRRILIFTSFFYVFGSAVLLVAQNFFMVSIGLLFAGAAATGIQIVTFGLLQNTFPEGKARVSAFTTFGMMFPLMYVVFPVLTGRLMEHQSWRISPVMWVVAGLAAIGISWFMLTPQSSRSPVGEMLTPILAGLGMAALAGFVNRGSAYGWTSQPALIAIAIAVVSFALCALRLRSRRPTSISLETLRAPGMRWLLLAVLIVGMVDTLVYVTLGVQYLYGMSSLAAAWALVPAQVGAVVGAKWVSSWMMNRFGVVKTGSIVLLAFAISLATLIFVQDSSPVYFTIGCITVFAVFATASITVVNTAIMGLAPAGQAGMVSSYRSAAVELGISLSVVILGSGMVAAANQSEETGNVDVADLVTAFHWNGIAGAASVVVAFLAFAWTAKRNGSKMNVTN